MSRPADLRTDTIRLTNVGLSYPGRGRDALSGVSMTIRPGDRITLTGPSGAGKSSLLALLLRLAEPTSGRIEVGDTDLARVPLGEWRRQIAWVPQDPHLFAASVADNIALGDQAASREAIVAAARAAGADEFIARLPQGYDTPIGEGGRRLSSGQRQQLALARAFLRDAPLLLLDEPAAHLDADTAARLDAALATLTAGRTVIRVAHDRRLVTGREFILDHGRPKYVARLLTRPAGRGTRPLEPAGAQAVRP